MYPVLFEFGHFQLRSYGVIVALSFLTALWLSSLYENHVWSFAWL
jgi:prolipoprotein diacylglyceryltransferase